MNEQRQYFVHYTRKLGSSDKRLNISMFMSEDSLKQILKDTKSKYAYVVKSAILVEKGVIK